MIGTSVCLMFAQAQRKRKDVYNNQVDGRCLWSKLSAYLNNFSTTLGRDLGLLFDANAGIHFALLDGYYWNS
jgi:hypothetical protein